MRRIVCWTIGLALIGAALGSKDAAIEFVGVLTGSLWGALAGLAIGWLLNKRVANSKKGETGEDGKATTNVV